MQPVLLAFRGVNTDEDKLLGQLGVEGTHESLVDVLFNVKEYEKSHPNFNYVTSNSLKGPLLTWLMNIF